MGISWDELSIRNGGFTFSAGSQVLPENTIIAVIGANGAGKSTLLRCLSGFNTNYDGAIKIDDRALSSLSLSERARTISWCPATYNVPFEFSTFDLVMMGRFVSHQGFPQKADVDATEAALETLDLKPFRDRPITQLSSGELQRVMIARTIAAENPYLFLDEPTANLDMAHALAVFAALKELKQSAVTTLVTVHDYNLACRFADCVLLLNNNQIADCGPADKVISTKSLLQALNIHTEKQTLSDGTSYFLALGSAGDKKEK